MVDEITKEQALKLVDTLNKENKELKEEKQQLIDYLEDRIKCQEDKLKNWKMNYYEYKYNLGNKVAYKEMLDFIKGGKEWR